MVRAGAAAKPGDMAGSRLADEVKVPVKQHAAPAVCGTGTRTGTGTVAAPKLCARAHRVRDLAFPQTTAGPPALREPQRFRSSAASAATTNSDCFDTIRHMKLVDGVSPSCAVLGCE